MKILVEIGHPAHIHYSKNAIKQWRDNGHEVIITARDKVVIKKLLNQLGFDYINRGKGRNSKLGKFMYMIYADLKLLSVSFKYKPDLYLSFSSAYAAQVAAVLGKPHIAFNDTEHTDKMHSRFTYPFSTTIITPASYQNDLGEKQIRFNNIDDGLYLHPNYFSPDPNIKSELGLGPDEEFVILRFVSWNAHHDYGQSGLDLSTKRKLIDILKTRYRIFISSEETLDEEFKSMEIDIPPHKMHDVLAAASLFVGESGTMASESAFLGTSSVYINSLPLMCYLKLEQDSGLLKHFKTSEGVVEYVDKLVRERDLKRKSIDKSNKMKENFIDPTKFLVWFVENYPESHKTMRDNPEFQKKFQ